MKKSILVTTAILAFFLVSSTAYGISIQVKETDFPTYIINKFVNALEVTVGKNEYAQGETAEGDFSYTIGEFDYDNDDTCGTSGTAKCWVHDPNGNTVDTDTASINDCTSILLSWSHSLSSSATTGTWDTTCNIINNQGTTEIMGQSAYWDVYSCDYSPSCDDTSKWDCYDSDTKARYTRETACRGGCTDWELDYRVDCASDETCSDGQCVAEKPKGVSVLEFLRRVIQAILKPY